MIRFLFYVEYSVEICRMEILFNVVKQKNDFNAQKENINEDSTRSRKKSFEGSFRWLWMLTCFHINCWLS